MTGFCEKRNGRVSEKIDFQREDARLAIGVDMEGTVNSPTLACNWQQASGELRLKFHRYSAYIG